MQRHGNIAQSVRDRLVRQAHTRGEDAMNVLIRYANERLLYRLSRSEYCDRFLLKGATLFAVWTQGVPHRPTRDVDFLASGDNAPEKMVAIFRTVCATPVEADGLTLDPDSVTAEPRRDDEQYPRLHDDIVALLGTARIPLQIDIGFGDAVTPSPTEVELPVLLPDLPRPRLRAYPRETVIAEKLEAMVNLGMGNSRMKDYFDLWYLSRGFAFDGPTLASAIRATFVRRGTVLPDVAPLALTEAFSSDTAKQAQWRGFLRRSNLVEAAPDLLVIVEVLRAFLWPPLDAARAPKRFEATWHPGGPWGGL
jgi:predicted nucleotidyltransferase component of viral defense system